MDNFDLSKRLSVFYQFIEEDSRITPMHICLYIALFELWSRNQGQNPVSVNRHKTMKLARIRGLATYHKYMKDLNNMGFISYRPSFHPGIRSEVHINNVIQQ